MSPTSSTSPLLCLPLELLYSIASKESLSGLSIKNLRLAHPTLARALTPILFRQIHLKLNTSSGAGMDRFTVIKEDCDIDWSDDDAVERLSSRLNKLDDEAAKHRTSLKDRINDLKKKSHTQDFLNAVRVFVVDAAMSSWAVDNTSALDFAKMKLGGDELAEWFPNLTQVVVKINAKGNSAVATKLIKGVFHQRSRVPQILDLTGIKTHRHCLQQTRNVSELSVDAEPSDLENFCDDVRGALARSHNLTRLKIGLWTNYRPEVLYARFTVKLTELLGVTNADTLKRLTTLELDFNVLSTTAGIFRKMPSLEEAIVSYYATPTQTWKLFGPWCKDDKPAKESIWDHLRQTNTNLKRISVKMIDHTLFNFLNTLVGVLSTLTIDVRYGHYSPQDHLRLINSFWNNTFPRITSNDTLKRLIVTSSVSFKDGETTTLALQIPRDADSLQQYFQGLEYVELGFVTNSKDDMPSILPTLQSAQSLNHLVLHAKDPTMKARSFGRTILTQKLERKMAGMMDPDDGNPICFKGGAKLTAKLYLGDYLDDEVATIDFLSRGNAWQRT